MFGFLLARQRDANAMIEKFLLNPLHGEKGCFLWFTGVCAILSVLWGERNSRIFRGVDKDPSEVWSLVHSHVSLWASVLKNLL